MSRLSRTKGAVAERDAAAILRLAFPLAERRCSGAETGSRISADRGRDIEGTPGYVFQVKATGKPQPLAALREAQSAASEAETPVAIVRQSARSGSTPFAVVLPVDDFLWLVSIAERFREHFPGRTAELREQFNERVAALRDEKPHLI